jgi:D-threo-aldose 1-dehydrogenase
VKTIPFKTPSGNEIRFTKLGFGAAPLGNLYRPLSEKQAQDTLESAWAGGMRYYDTAPLYGLGLSETRINHFLRGKKRADYVISTKVGRRLEVCPPAERTALGKFFETPSRREVYDYSYDGVLRSFESSLERLGLDSVDILFVHDIDIFNHGSEKVRDAQVDVLMKGGYRALLRLREEKVIKAFGAGVNEWQVCEILAKRGNFDLFLLAGRYTLLEQESIESLLPLCEKRGIGIVLGGPFNSGILAQGARKSANYNYSTAPKAVLDKVAALEKICRRHGVKLPVAALHFPYFHKQVVSVIPGAAAATEIRANLAFLKQRVPKALWKDMKAAGLIHPDAPTG